MYLIRDLYPEYVKNSYHSKIKEINVILYIAKDLNTHFSKEDMQMTEYMKVTQHYCYRTTNPHSDTTLYPIG